MRLNEKQLRTTSMWVLLVAALAMSATGTTLNDTFSLFTTSVEIEPTSAVTGLTIDQNNNALGMQVSVTNTNTNDGVFLTDDSSSTVTRFLRTRTSATGTNYFYRDLAAANTASPVVFIEQDNAGDDQNTLLVQQDGTGWTGYFQSNGGSGVIIDQNNDNVGLEIDSEATNADGISISLAGTGDAIQAENGGVVYSRIGSNTAASYGSNYFLRNDVAANTGGPLVFIEQDNAGDDQVALDIQQDGTNYAIYARQNGNAPAVAINQHASNGAIIFGGDGSCNAGQYHIYEASGDLYWCKNGVAAMLN